MDLDKKTPLFSSGAYCMVFLSTFLLDKLFKADPVLSGNDVRLSLVSEPPLDV